MKKNWIYDYRDVEFIASKYNIYESIAEILLKRVNDENNIEQYLNSDKEEFYPAKKLKDVDKAVDRILKAFKKKENIVIFHDYDVDGTTGGAIFYKTLSELKEKLDCGEITTYTPERDNEGYGLNKKAIKKLAKTNSLLITVDLGITAKKEVDYVKDELDVIITDHHEISEENFPNNAIAVVNPKQGKYPYENLCGSFVALKVAERLMQVYLKDDNFRFNNEYLDLAAIATIADRVPLIDENRILVKKRLSKLKETKNIGLKALVQKIEKKELTSSDIGFQIGPLINAASRMEHANLIMELFTSDDRVEVSKIAEHLEEINKKRKTLTTEQEDRAIEIIEKEKYFKDNVIVLIDEKFTAGLAGLVCSRIVEKYNRPTIIVDKVTGKGSARSIEGINIYQGLTALKELLDGFGGHEMAAGLTINSKNISEFRKKINKWANQFDKNLFEKKYKVDTIIPLYDCSLDLMEQLDVLRPFGEANTEPLFATKNIKVLKVDYIGEGDKHLDLTIQKNSTVKQAKWWNKGEWGKKYAKELVGKTVDILYSPHANTFRGETTIDLFLEDLIINKEKKAEKEVDKMLNKLYESADEILSGEKYRGIAQAKGFNTKLAGTSFDGRQEMLGKIKDKKNIKAKLVRQGKRTFEYKTSQYDTLKKLARRFSISIEEIKKINKLKNDEVKIGQKLVLRDANAIAVEVDSVGEIGFLNASLAKKIAPVIDSGIEYSIDISQITGGDNKNYGCNVYVSKKTNKKDLEIIVNKKERKRIEILESKKILEEVRDSILGKKGLDFLPKQKEALQQLYGGKNVLTIMGTGRGKSLIFQSWAGYNGIKNKKSSLFLYPLRALISDQFHSLRENMAQLGLQVYEAKGELRKEEKKNLFKALKSNTADIILGTPEFVEHYVDKFKEANINFLVIDEAHYISATHRQTYKNLGSLVKKLNIEQIFACSATVNEKTAKKLIEDLKINAFVKDPFIRKNLKMIDNRGFGIVEKREYIKELIRNAVENNEKTIIFLNSREKATRLAMEFKEMFEVESFKTFSDNARIAFYHSELTNEERKDIEKYFKKGDIQVLFSTSAFGEGVNIPDIRHVALYHMNFNVKEFVQQAGRAGRDHKDSYIHLLFNKQDVNTNTFILKMQTPDKFLIKDIYKIFKQLSKKTNPFKIELEKIVEYILEKINRKTLTETEILAFLKIAEELKLLKYVEKNEKIYVKINEDIDLNGIKLKDSVIYLEGLNDKSEFADFKNYIFNVSAEELLAKINRPIIPENI
ncbi:MAG: single-stranded-DNA-specific exonuclease RecJ [archaeon]